MAHLPYIFFLILPIFSFRKPVPAFLPSWCHKMTNYTTPNLNFWPLGIRKNRFFLKENLKTPFFFFLETWLFTIVTHPHFKEQLFWKPDFPNQTAPQHSIIKVTPSQGNSNTPSPTQNACRGGKGVLFLGFSSTLSCSSRFSLISSRFRQCVGAANPPPSSYKN